MALPPVDKTKITKYLKDHAFGDICYLGLCDAIGKRDKISDLEFLQYFTQCVANEFRKDISLVKEKLPEFSKFQGIEYDEDSLYEVLEKIIDHYKSNNKIKIDIDFNPSQMI